MTRIHPHDTETYSYTTDDGCLVVASGSQTEKKIWLSAHMLEWIATDGMIILEKANSTSYRGPNKRARVMAAVAKLAKILFS